MAPGVHNSEDLPRTMDQRASAEILVLGQIRDTLVTLTTSLTDVRERVIRIEASDIATQIARLEAQIEKSELETIRVRQEFAAQIEKDKQETNRVRTEMTGRIHKLELENARWKGLFAPLAILGSAFLSGLVTWVLRSLPPAGG